MVDEEPRKGVWREWILKNCIEDIVRLRNYWDGSNGVNELG